jgi:dihydropteroate synthase
MSDSFPCSLSSLTPDLCEAAARFNPRVIGTLSSPPSSEPIVALALEGLDSTLIPAVSAAAAAVGVESTPGGAPDRLHLRGMLAALRQLAVRLPGSTGTQALADVLEAALGGYFEALADESPTRVVGILNVTPDSFSDGSRYLDAAAAQARAREMVAEGADWIDVGGESTRPGSEPVPAKEELQRVLPVVEALAGTPNVTLSIDTTKAAVAERCLAAGATIVNDVSGLTFDPLMAEVVAAAGAGLVLMHIRGTPRTMQVDPVYDDVVADTLRFLRRQVAVAVAAGVPAGGIWIDPGFGFGKTVAHNLEILRRLREYTSAGLPIFVGPSRKSALGRLLARGDEPIPAPEQRLEATAATVAIAIAHGARAVRVHDVREMARVARVTDAILGRGGR